MEMAKIGRIVSVELPAGKRIFAVGGDEVIGLYQAHSLHSPVLNFHPAGSSTRRGAANACIADDAAGVTEEAAATSGSGRQRLDRRALLFGRRGA